MATLPSTPWRQAACHWLNRAAALVMLLGTVLIAPADARTITVVYDDSGSMKAGDRWSYASYSLQVIRGLLKPMDELNVVYMNQPAVDTFGGAQAQAQVDRIRTRANHAGRTTPYNAVQRAMKAVADSRDTDNWLFVITDGQFEIGVPDRLSDEVRAFLAARPGTRTAFLGIAQSEPNPVFDTWHTTASAQVYRAQTVDQIIPTMVSIGTRLTSLGGGAGAAGLRPQVSGRQITIAPELPLRRFVILQQATRPDALVPIESATVGGESLVVSSPVRASAPGSVQSHALIQHLYLGNAAPLKAGSRIEATLARGIDAQASIAVLPEVDGTLDVVLTDDYGRPLAQRDGTDVLCDGRQVVVTARLRNGAGVVIEGAPGGLRVSGRVGDRPLDFQPEGATHRAQFGNSGSTQTLSVEGTVPGYADLQENRQLRTEPCPPRRIEFTAYQGGGPLPGGRWEAPVTALDTAEPLDIRATIDGKPATRQELDELKASLDTGPLASTVEPLDDGWRVTPTLKWGSPAFTPTGDFPLVVAAPGARPDDVVSKPDLQVRIADPGFMARFGSLLMLLLALLAALVYVYGVVTKPRLDPRVKVRFTSGGINHPGGRQPKGLWAWLKRYLVPYRAERLRVPGLGFPLLASRRRGVLEIAGAHVPPGWMHDLNTTLGGRPVKLLRGHKLVMGTGELQRVLEVVD